MSVRFHSLKARLALLGLISVLGVCLLSALSLIQTTRIKANLVVFADRHIALNHHATRTYAQGLQMGQALRNIVLDPANRKAYENFAQASESFKEVFGALEPLVKAEDAAAAEELAQRVAAWRPLQAQVLALVQGGEADAARALLTTRETPAWRAVREILLAQVKRSDAAAEGARVSLLADVDTIAVGAAVVGVATLAVVLGATLWVGRAVFRQVGGEPSATAASLARIAAGDLTGEIRPRAGDRDSILAAASDMQAHLAGLVRSIGRGAVSMMQASEAIARNAESVADTAERQSQATSGIAAAVEELTVSIGVMSDNAVHAASLSGQTEGKVQDGLTQVSATTDTIRQVAEGMTAFAETMGELSSKVSGINGIVQAIHEIAEQTNLLALNAAIEAARAGEQGRGFAVVADEVRKLAERTATSTQEISAMIAGVQDSTRVALDNMARTRAVALEGARHMDQTQEAVAGLSTVAAGVREEVDAIRAALDEQRAASTDIARRVEQIAQGIEGTHVSAAASSRSAQELVALAHELEAMTGRFRVSA